MAPNPLTKEESLRVTTVMTNACQDQINTDFSKVCEIFKVCGIESLKYVREFHTPVCNCGDISTHRNMTRNETNCDWLFYMLVKRGRALANESYHRFQTFSHQSEVEVDRYGFFSGRCWYLEITAVDGWYRIPHFLIFFYLLLQLKHVRNVVWSFLKKIVFIILVVVLCTFCWTNFLLHCLKKLSLS